MITFTGQDQFSALFDRIAAQGHYAANHDGVWVTDNDAAVQMIIDGFTLTDAVNAVLADMYTHAAQLRMQATAGISPQEMASWSIKRNEALAYNTSKNAADAPNLSNEATKRGIALDAMVSIVLNNASEFASLESQISGNAGHHKDALKALAAATGTTFAQIRAYDWSTGWPAV